MLELRGVYKVYDMGEVEVAALDGVDFRMRRGEFVSVVGASGSGKSSLLHVVGCLDTATAGSYLLEGQEVTRLPDRELSRIRNRHFGFILQAYNLLPDLNALENVEQTLVYAGVPARERRERAGRALEGVGLGDCLEHLPSQLSGGQQQRVAIARALINAPTPLSRRAHRQPQQRGGRRILEIIAGLHEGGMSVLMVTHDPRVAGVAERQFVLQDGKVARDHPVAERTRLAPSPAA